MDAGAIDEAVKEICRLMVRLIQFGRYDELQQVLAEMQEIQDETLDGLREVMEIYRTESESITGGHSAWFDARSWEQIQTDYEGLCALLFESAEDCRGAQAETLRGEIAAGRISHDAVRKAMCRLTLRERTLELLWELPERPLVSVVVCVYNGEAFVRDTLDSIIGQTSAMPAMWALSGRRENMWR